MGECGAPWGRGGTRLLTFDLTRALVGLFQLLVNPMNIYEDQKVVTLYSLVG